MLNPFIVMREAEGYFHLPPGKLVTHDRHMHVVKARGVAMYLMRTMCKLSYPEIGEYFEREHDTVMYHCKKIVKELKLSSDSLTGCAIIDLTQKLIRRGH